jgi:hypothetical protein
MDVMEPDRSDNPVADSMGPVKGGALRMDEVVNLIAADRQAERKAADARLEAKLEEMLALRDAGGAPGIDAIRRVFGTASSVPCNWHQATIFFLGSDAPEDAAMKSRAQWMVLAGLVMVVFQVLRPGRRRRTLGRGVPGLQNLEAVRAGRHVLRSKSAEVCVLRLARAAVAPMDQWHDA